MFSLLLWFFRRRRRPLCVCFFFLFKRESSGRVTGHTPTRNLCFCPFSFCVSPATGLISRFGRASFLSGVLSGCHSGPRAFFGFSRDFSEAFFSDARRQGCFIASRACVVFPLFVLFCSFTPFLEARVGFLAEVGSPSRLFEPKWAERAVPRGALLARRVGPLHSGILTAYFCSHRVTGTPQAFLSGEGAPSLPPQAPFHTHLFLFPAPVFFLLGPSRPSLYGGLLRRLQQSSRRSD